MKTIKLLADYGEHKSGATVALEDGEAGFIVKGKFGTEVVAPTGVGQKVNAATEAIIERLVAKVLGEVEKKATGSRPNLVVNPDNRIDDPTDGFKASHEFYKSVHVAGLGRGEDERLTFRRKANGASENVNADGGYTVPVQYATTIFNDIISQDSLMNQCFMVPMESNSMKMPAINYLKQGQFGVTAYWEGEGATIPTSKPPFRQPSLVLNKLTVLTPVTNELLEDGIAVESTINYLASEALTYKINDAIINGTGAGQPIGVVQHPSTIVRARTTANAVVTADIVGMQSQYLGDDNRAVWLISKADVNPQLLTLQDGAGRYLYFAPGTMGDNKGPSNLLGMRVRPLINCQPLGNQGDIILWDPKSYLFGYKSTGVQKAMSIHVYFATDEVAYRWTFRCDGRPWRDTTIQAAKSNNLLYSPAVELSTKLS